MQSEELRAIQAPLKDRYRAEPGAAQITLKALGTLDSIGLTCKVETGQALVTAGLHPATGGDGSGIGTDVNGFAGLASIAPCNSFMASSCTGLVPLIARRPVSSINRMARSLGVVCTII